MLLPFLLFALAAFGIFVLSVNFSIWTSVQRFHWIFKFMILILAPSPLLLVGGSELMLILIVSNLSVFFLIALERNRQKHQLSENADGRRFYVPKFGIEDLLISTLAFATLFFVSQVAELSFLDTIHSINIGLAIATWNMFWIAIRYWNVSWKLKVAMIPVLAITLGFAAMDDRWLLSTGAIATRYMVWLFSLLMLVGVTAFFRAVAMKTFEWKYSLGIEGNSEPNPAAIPQPAEVQPADATLTDPQDGGMRTTKNRFGIWRIISAFIFGSLAIGMAGSIVYFFFGLIFSATIKENLVPYVEGKPNGFEEYLLAGEKFAQSRILDPTVPTPAGPKLRAEIDTFADAFDQVDAGLTMPNQAWIDWSKPNQDNLQSVSIAGWIVIGQQPKKLSINYLRTVARAFQAKSRQEVFEKNHETALEDAIKVIKVSRCASQDGNYLVWLLGSAVERMGISIIPPLLKEISTERLQACHKELKSIFESSSTLDHIDLCEYSTMSRSRGLRDRALIVTPEYRKLAEPARGAVADTMASLNSSRGQLLILILLELYRREKQEYPKSLKEIGIDDSQTGQLEEVYKDPFTTSDKSFQYHLSADGNSFRLYSIGRNQIDEGGKIDPTGNPLKADLNLVEFVKLWESQREAEIQNAKELEAELMEESERIQESKNQAKE